MEVSVPGIKLSESFTGSIKQTYTHEFKKSQSFAMEFQTSSVHEKLDGGAGSIADFHFRYQPVIHRMVIAPPTKASERLAAKRSIAASIRRSVLHAGTRLPADLVKKLANTSEADVAIDSKKGIVVGGYPLVDLMLEYDVAADNTSSVLVMQYRVFDLGSSYGNPAHSMLPALIAHKSHVLRKVTAAAIMTGTVTLAAPGGVPVAIAWPPEIHLKTTNLDKLQQWINDQIASWIDRVNYRTGSLHEQLTDWMDSRPTLSIEASRLGKKFPEAAGQLSILAKNAQQSIEQWKTLQLDPGIANDLRSLEPGFYVPNSELLDLEKPGKLTPAQVRKWNIEINAAALEIQRAARTKTWIGPDVPAPDKLDSTRKPEKPRKSLEKPAKPQ